MSRRLPRALSTIMHGAESEPEGILINRCRLAGLPTPLTQYQIIPTRKYRYDLAFVEFRVSVEVQGGGERGAHSRFIRYAADQEKSALAQLMGWTTIAVTPAQIRSGKAVEWITAALRMRGWSEPIQSGPVAR